MEHCCPTMTEQVNHTCTYGHDCPDQVVRHYAPTGRYSLPIRDGGTSGITIEYCPWCGQHLPTPPTKTFAVQVEAA